MSKTNDILKKVSNQLRPSQEDKRHTEYFAAELMNVATKIAKSYSVIPMLCGSVSKNTWLPNKNELDLFLLFKPSVPRSKLEKDGLELANEIISTMKGKADKKYSEHPYLCGKIKFGRSTFDVDVVPCYDIKNLKKIKSAVDRTPHHVKYVKKKLLLPDDVRLLKQFCKANGIYGADVKTNGFSGYLCELMIIHYGKFSNLIKEAVKWRVPMVLTMNKTNKIKLVEKFEHPFIVIDPVDSNRNVAAAVSPENFYKFVHFVKKFNDNPSEKLFFPAEKKPYTIVEIEKKMKERGTWWYMIGFKKPEIPEDTLYPQMKRGLNSVQKILEHHGFSVMRKDLWLGDSCIYLFEMDVWTTPSITKNIGPNVYTKHAENFLKHYKERNIFIEGDEWVVELEKEYTIALHLLKDLIKKNDNELREKGIPSKIVTNFSKGSVVSGTDVIKMIKYLPEDFRVFMKDWFEKDIDIV
ncbi:MAG: CCA tRNA nucleotidyltransferase [Nanoarchaeota archaeon]|nr:CCA tRNA nucleotidyltransferase [Nanoarchaeota archaeon]